jgi:hypothetical protein
MSARESRDDYRKYPGVDAKLLIAERSGEIYALLRRRFSSTLILDTRSFLDTTPDKFKNNNYDMFVCAMDGSYPPKSKLQEVRESLARNSPKTQIIVISDEEPEHCI